MRVSTDKSDPDYVPPQVLCTYKIFLDGAEQSQEANGRGIISADDWAGEIEFYELLDGQFRKAGNHFVRCMARGNVQIMYPGQADRPKPIDFGRLTRF